MNVDLVPAGNFAANLLSGEWSQGIAAFFAVYGPWLALLAFLIALGLSGFGRRVRKVIEEMFFTNWQLTLLGSAALILSLAGGWTTWDGMRNFTGEPVLSLMFTFGIHGVMLIVAWLIGESFATGMSSVPQRGYARVTAPLIAITAVAGLLLLVALAAYHFRYGIPADQLMHVTAVAGAIMLGFVLLTVFSGSDVVAPYTQALRIIARNGMLWVMFLACMSTSVFFSFDSRFNVVFPQEERKRVADLRAQNQVIGILADIEATMTNRRLEQSKQLFESDGWRAYEPHLVNLANASQSSQRDIERYFVQQMEDRRRGVAEQQERITTAQTGQVGLANKKLSMTEELTRLKGERPGLAGEYSQHKSELEAKRRDVDAKRVEALAEDRGVEGSGKAGKGQVYRQRMGELRYLEDEYEIKEQRTKDAQKRLNTVETRIAQIERELTGIDGEIAKMKGEAQTAEQRIKAVQEAGAAVDGPKVDPARALLAFETARGEFRQEPTVEHLTQVQQLCGQLHGAMSSTPATKDKVRSIDCDPKQASEAASALFALNAGSKTFQANCAGGDKLAAFSHADELFGFARKCLADSGLPSKDTDALRTKISFTELTRDDRAHRFVVSWNAFSDGNRLAYLALAIAIGIDSLIFMTGLFGANAVRSPLSDVPSSKPRNAQQLEAVIETALLPDRYENANAVIDALEPITPHDGFTAEVVLPREETPGKRRIMKVLNAAATLGAVGRDPDRPERYLVRGELFEFLSVVAKKEFEADKRHVDMAELERIISVALLPRVGENAETVLSYMHPIREKQGFTSEIRLGEVEKEHKRTVRSALNAGATLERVQRAGEDPNHYLIHGDFYKTLARIRGRLLISAAPAYQAGGALQSEMPRIGIEARRPVHAIEHANGLNGALAVEHKKQRLLEELLEAIELSPEAYELVTTPHVSGAAIAAGTALRRQGPPHSRLGEYLRLKESAWRNALEQARHAIRAREGDDHSMVRLTDEVASDIAKILPALMLLPQSRVLSGLVQELESAASQDDLPEEQQRLKDWLSQLQKDLRRIDLSNEVGWHRAQHLIEFYSVDAADPDTEDHGKGHKLPS
jgi:hypothetical protein